MEGLGGAGFTPKKRNGGKGDWKHLRAKLGRRINCAVKKCLGANNSIETESGGSSLILKERNSKACGYRCYKGDPGRHPEDRLHTHTLMKEKEKMVKEYVSGLGGIGLTVRGGGEGKTFPAPSGEEGQIFQRLVGRPAFQVKKGKST